MKNYAPQLKSTVLKVSHHGSCNATATSFLAAVSPDYALISNGEPPRPAARTTLVTLTARPSTS